MFKKSHHQNSSASGFRNQCKPFSYSLDSQQSRGLLGDQWLPPVAMVLEKYLTSRHLWWKVYILEQLLLRKGSQAREECPSLSFHYPCCGLGHPSSIHPHLLEIFSQNLKNTGDIGWGWSSYALVRSRLNQIQGSTKKHPILMVNLQKRTRR